MTERELLEGVRKLAALYGWLMYHTHDSRRSAPGFPDIVLVRPPRVLFVELKTETGQLTPEQHRWLGSLAQCADGWIGSTMPQLPGRSPVEVYIWRPSHLEGIVRILGSRDVRA